MVLMICFSSCFLCSVFHERACSTERLDVLIHATLPLVGFLAIFITTGLDCWKSQDSSVNVVTRYGLHNREA
jgi:hypothetical protein